MNANHLTLAPYAASQELSKGRLIAEKPSRYRSEFQRDRDRIIHCTAFRRLEYKTQVFVNHEGDLYRTRLTHSLEVSQVGRTVARALQLNEDLIETICLAHDLGHTPFGHAGQDALNACMRDYGGFEHNLQSLRVVDVLEHKYPAFNGLNLTFESREGILKHCSNKNARQLCELGERFLNNTQPSAEAQLADLADSIAYNHHDVDDGLRSGIISLTQLREIAFFDRHYLEVLSDYPKIDERRTIYETIRRMFGDTINELTEHSRQLIERAQPNSIDEVRAAQNRIIELPEDSYANHLQLKRFLRQNLYRHEKVVQMTNRAKLVVRELFNVFANDIKKMPSDFAEKATTRTQDDQYRARIIADYIAGMTDRYAIDRYNEFIGESGL